MNRTSRSWHHEVHRFSIELDKYLTKEIPIIFPDELVHEDVANSLHHVLLEHYGQKENSVISAGFISVGLILSCHGRSETLGIESRGIVDETLIRQYDYMHGLVY